MIAAEGLKEIGTPQALKTVNSPTRLLLMLTRVTILLERPVLKPQKRQRKSIPIKFSFPERLVTQPMSLLREGDKILITGQINQVGSPLLRITMFCAEGQLLLFPL